MSPELRLVTLQPQGMPQSCINVTHWKRPNAPVNFSFGNGSQIISHDNRICEQARLLSFESRKLDNNTALVRSSKHPTGYQGQDYLRQSGLKVIGLNNQCRTSLGCPQIGMGKKY
jgi:hypothetical protein